MGRGNWTWNASIQTPMASLVMSLGSQRRRLTGITQESASVVGGTSSKRIEATRAGSADVTVAACSLQALTKALDLAASIDMDLNLVSHGTRTIPPVHSSGIIGVDLLLLSGMGRGCRLSIDGSSGVFGDSTTVRSGLDVEMISGSFKAARKDFWKTRPEAPSPSE